ncbi:MAG: photosynthetic complex putative assembly protein PuhB [Pseudomonadota bacterium]
MDLNLRNAAPSNAPADSPAGAPGLYGRGEIPEAATDAIFRRALDEDILWRGQPEPLRHAASAFHTNSVAFYFAVLTGIAYATSDLGSAITVAVMGVVGVLVLLAMGIYSARRSAYVLTSHRLIILTGLAVDKRISIPLKHVGSAELKPRSNGHGDIALEITVQHRLGYVLLWPHARPFRFLRPQPLLRAVPDVENVAAKLAQACAQYAPIEQNLTDVKDLDVSRANPELGGATA